MLMAGVAPTGRLHCSGHRVLCSRPPPVCAAGPWLNKCSKVARTRAQATVMAQQQQHAQARSPSPQPVEDALQAAQALLDSIQAGGGQPSMSSPDLGYTGTDVACDASGCVLVVQQDSRHETEPPFQHMLSGPNWSLGLLISQPGPYVSQSFATATFSTDSSMEQDPLIITSSSSGSIAADSDSSSSSDGSQHAALVAGPNWRVLLSAADFADLVHMLGQLRMAVASLRFQMLWNAGSKDRPASRAKWEGAHFKLMAVYAPGEPGFSVTMTFLHEDDYSGAVRAVSTSWPADVTAAVVEALDDTLGYRPLAVRGT